MVFKCFRAIPLLIFAGCSTLNQSLELGAGIGALSGGAATFAGYAAGDNKANIGDIAVGAGIGAAVGLLTSYLVHRSVEDDRSAYDAQQTEMHFGDLPPSPFIVPKKSPFKGGK